MFHRASMSKRFPSVNSRKLSESIGTNERAQPATNARLTLLSAEMERQLEQLRKMLESKR
jgi:hypothetical protein